MKRSRRLPKVRAAQDVIAGGKNAELLRLFSMISTLMRSENCPRVAVAECGVVAPKHQRTLSVWIDYGFTYCATFGLVFAGLIIYRIIAIRFGDAGVSEYALTRRIVSFIQLPLGLGLLVTLSRKISSSRYGSTEVSETTYSLAALVLLLLETAILFVGLFSKPAFMSYLFFGSRDYEAVILMISPMFLAWVLHIVCYAQFHGRNSLRLASSLQLFNLGVIPVAMTIVAPTVSAAFLWTGVAISITCIVVTCWQFRRYWNGLGRLASAGRELVRFGLPRVPGDVALAALMLLPATLAAHERDVKYGGLVAFSVTLLTLAQTMTIPISTMLLPKATELLNFGMIIELRTKVLRLLLVGIGMTGLGLIGFYLWTDLALRICLGEYAIELPRLARVVMLGAIPLNAYTCLRSVADAGNDRAVNARSCCIALMSFFLVWPIARLLWDAGLSAPIALVVALSVLAGLTAWEVIDVLKPDLEGARSIARELPRKAA
jgi:O-antigen/teichoic acid export membrane protein